VSANGIEPNDSAPENLHDPAPEQIAACRLWLRVFAIPTKTIRPARDSYSYKHLAEDFAGEYVSNGAFIQAAILEGFRIERARSHGSVNAWLALRIRRRGETPGPANDAGPT
jgi:hypothetical protein